jgi:peptidyl-prolyl cis-trans isomerase SurA
MKRYYPFALLPSLILSSLFAQAADIPTPIIPVDRIVAVVNNQVITWNELNTRTDQIIRQLQKQGIPLMDRSILLKQVLDKMILDDTEMQYAKDTGISLDDAQLDLAVSQIAQDNKMSLAQFQEKVRQDGIPWDKFREDIRQEIILARLRDREVNSRITVTPAEVEGQLKLEDKTTAITPTEYELAHILVEIPNSPTEAQVNEKQQKIEQALKLIQGGKSFTEVATLYSEAPDALKGGELGWKTSDVLPELFAQTVKTMKPGEVSGILRSSSGFHIIKLLNERDGQTTGHTNEQYHLRQILININPDDPANAAEKKINNLYELLKKGASFSDLATQDSEDESRNRGGDLGWVSEGATLPAFEEHFKNLKVNEISQPFQTSLGWHIIQLLGTRDINSNDEAHRAQIIQNLKTKKADKAYDEWLRQLRGQAYVENRLDDK